jgi:hypothetical protein
MMASFVLGLGLGLGLGLVWFVLSITMTRVIMPLVELHGGVYTLRSKHPGSPLPEHLYQYGARLFSNAGT